MNRTSSNTVQAFWVSIGSLVSFAFGIVSSMILSRYFTKEDYGTYKQVMFVYATLLSVFTLGLPKAYGYFIPRVSIEEGKSAVNKITNIFFLLGGVFSLCLFLFSPLIATVLNNPQLNTAIKIFSPVPLLLLPTMGLESIYATYRKTHISSIYLVITRVLMLICVVCPVTLGGDYTTALWGFVISSAISFFIALYLKSCPFKGLVHQKCNIAYRQIFKFSLPLLYASIFGTIIQSADQFFISRYFGVSTFAEFSNGFMELPFVGMIIGACSTVLFPLFSKMDNERLDPKIHILPIWTSVFEKTAKLIYPMLVFCWFFADYIMVVLYGSQYEGSGIYFKIRLVYNLFTLISFAPLILALGKTAFYAKVHMYVAVALIVLEYVSILTFKSPHLIAVISVTCNIGKILVFLFVIASYFQTSVLALFPIKLIGKIVIPSILILTVIRYLVRMDNILYNLIAAAAIYSLIYLLWAIAVKIDYYSLVKPLLNYVSAKKKI